MSGTPGGEPGDPRSVEQKMVIARSTTIIVAQALVLGEAGMAAATTVTAVPYAMVLSAGFGSHTLTLVELLPLIIWGGSITVWLLAQAAILIVRRQWAWLIAFSSQTFLAMCILWFGIQDPLNTARDLAFLMALPVTVAVLLALPRNLAWFSGSY